MAEGTADATLRAARKLLERGETQQAERLYRQLLARGVEHTELLSNLAVICWRQGHVAEMEALLRRCLSRDPGQGDVHYNLALVLAQRGAAAEAIEHYRQALPLANATLRGSIHWNLSKLLLRCGHYTEGWEHYEWRRHKAQPLPPICEPGMPSWQEGPVADGELVLVGEQGLGDMIQFLRYAPAMVAVAPRVSLALPEKLHGLVEASGLAVQLLTPAQVSAQRHGQWLPLLSSARLLGIRPDNVLISAPYLQIPAERQQRWRQRLRADLAAGERLIGLHWQGNPATETSELQGRSLPLEALAPLAAVAGVRLVSLQKGPGSEQLAGSAIAQRLVAAQPEVDHCWDFVDTGAMLLACDLVISSDSALAHLAGALGAPTWLLLHHLSDWRWGEAGESSFWYPSLRLFRQQEPGDWAGLIEAVVAALGALADDDARERRAEALIQQGRLKEAEALYRQLIAASPPRTNAYINLAVICGQSGRNSETITLLQKSLELNPKSAETHNNLGIALQIEQRHDQAIEHFKTAHALKPESAEINFNLGNALVLCGQDTEAIAAFQQALQQRAAYPEALFNLSQALQRQQQPLAAAELLKQALELDGEQPLAWAELGDAQHALGRFEEAIHSYSQALAGHPSPEEVRAKRSLVLLLRGQFEQGWSDYESRLQLTLSQPLFPVTPPCPRWDGSRLKPNTPLLLVAEQGLGDTLQFMRFAPMLREQGIAVHLCAPTKLHGLIQASGIDPAPITATAARSFTTGYWLPLLSLPGLLGLHPLRNPAQLLPESAYIRSSSERLESWRHLLAEEPRPIIAIHWQGNPQTETLPLHRGRSLPLEAFAPIAAMGVGCMLSLQKGPGSEQLHTCSFRGRFVRCQPQVDAAWDFLDTAALIANCDLVISNDTAAAHLAAGMGHPTWLLLQHVAEWRWGEAGDSSAWYASMRLFRQQAPGDWAGVIEAVVEALRRRGSASGDLEPAPQPDPREQHAIALLQQGEIAGAAEHYQSLIADGQASAQAFGNLGAIRLKQGRIEAAIELLNDAVERDPNLGAAHNNLGTACRRQGDLQAALQHYRQAVLAEPGSAEFQRNLGLTLHETGAVHDAALAFQQAVALQPDHANTHNLLGVSLKQSGAHQAAIRCFERALELQTTFPEALNNLGNTWLRIGQPQRAIEAYTRALDQRPAYHKARKGRAMARLLIGEDAAGWVDYEARLHGDDQPTILNAQPRCPLWSEGNLNPGSQLLLVSEQGLGDTLQFMRYVPLLQARGIVVQLCTPESLHRLIQASGITADPLSPARGDAVESGVWLPLLSLPARLGVSCAKPLTATPYLHTSEARIRHWAERFRQLPRPLIAINWQGNPVQEQQSNSSGRSLPLEAFAPIAALGIGTLVSLQKGFGSEQLAGCSFRDRFVPCQNAVDQAWDFLDAAAIIANCDLVITSDTAVAHLAGGLGHPTWLLLQHVPDWRWGLRGERCSWYPSMRLFRQPQSGDWGSVMAAVAAALPAAAAERQQRRSQERERQALQLLRQQRTAEAEALYRQLLQEGEATATVFANLGALCGASGRLEEAVPLLVQALNRDPRNTSSLANLAEASCQQGAWLQAEPLLQRALECDPKHLQALNRLRSVASELGRHEQAITLARRALELAPEAPEAHFNLGVEYKKAGRLQEARASYERALERRPDDADAAANLSMILLLQGHYARGLQLREARLCKTNPVVPILQPNLPRWHPGQDEPLLVVGEQGLGDMLQFLRYVPGLRDTQQDVWLCLPENLIELARVAGLARTVLSPEAWAEAPPAHRPRQWVPLLSLPWHLGVTPHMPLVDAPYLQSTPHSQRHWRQRIRASAPGPVVGVHWQGNLERGHLLGRSLPLEELAPLADLEEIALLSLQKGYGSEQLQGCGFRDRFVSCQAEVDACWSFVDTAAMVLACDLVITSDSALAHLAGALGAPTWLLLHHQPDWRWGLESERSFWYPSLRLFRQQHPGDWAGVIQRVRAALQEWLAAQ